MRSASPGEKRGASSKHPLKLELTSARRESLSARGLRVRRATVAVRDDLIGALEAQPIGVARRRIVVLLRIHIDLYRIAAQLEDRREAHDVARQRRGASRRSALAVQRRLTRSLGHAAPPQLGANRIRQSRSDGQSDVARAARADRRAETAIRRRPRTPRAGAASYTCACSAAESGATFNPRPRTAAGVLAGCIPRARPRLKLPTGASVA